MSRRANCTHKQYEYYTAGNTSITIEILNAYLYVEPPREVVVAGRGQREGVLLPLQHSALALVQLLVSRKHRNELAGVVSDIDDRIYVYLCKGGA